MTMEGVSGLSGSREIAQSQVLVGIGLLAGSTVMLLTVLWGSCFIVGKCDIEDGYKSFESNRLNNVDFLEIGFSFLFKLMPVPIVVLVLIPSKELVPNFSRSKGSGISTDIWTSYAAIIMAVSVIPFIIVQLPQLFHSSSERRLSVLIALIVAVALLFLYCVYQVFQPWIQERKLNFAKHKHVISGILKYLKMHALGRLLTDDGDPNIDVIRKLFQNLDNDSDERLSPEELRALILGIRFIEIDFDEEDAVGKVLKDFDTSGDSFVDEDEFINGISKWLEEAKHSVPALVDAGSNTTKFINDFHSKTKQEHNLLASHSDVGEGSVGNSRWTTIKAVSMLLLGTAISASFADPLVGAVGNFSSATRIPSFFISFIVLPLATNSSEAVLAIIFAKRKKQRTASLTFSELKLQNNIRLWTKVSTDEGSNHLTVNNHLCLAVFLALVYARQLTWDFSAEVLIIVIVSVVMGVFGSVRTTLPLWTSTIAFALYPFSLVLVYILDYVFGWSSIHRS
ncbi:hypothetical protein Scep_028100 [Stephania cephalantha]|uniref:EF-hand domain-containing protein n=1 Tax=Stephania cephalantha TaxID=152367 RepID=A0AAP0EGM7_9MAGN